MFEGYFWFVIWEGLVCYNGLDFIVFDCSMWLGLCDNGVGVLYVDYVGNLWISDLCGNVICCGSDG